MAPGDQKPLTLTAREVASAFPDQGVHAHGKTADVVIESGQLRRLPGVLHGQVGGEADNVIEDIAREELGVLQEDADLAADLAEVQGRQLATIVGSRSESRG